MQLKFKIKLLLCTTLFISNSVLGQKFDIPEGKYDLYWNVSFLDKCRKSSSSLPFKVEISKNSCVIGMEYGNIFAHVAVPFILDGDTILLYYTKIERDDDTGEIINQFNTWFDFKAIGFFEYKYFWVVIYSFPLADPNKYQCYTINTYSKDGKRIDRLSFLKWECKQFSVIDISWFDITGYIDENFEITIQTQGSWNDINTNIYKRDELAEKKEKKYSVYQINDQGQFALIKKTRIYS